MTELPVSLANNVEFLRRLQKLDRFSGLSELGRSLRPGIESPLVEVPDFGTNPGHLRMFAYVPEHLQQPRALVVVLHACGQTAAGYDHGAGWSTLARQYGFALLMPEQQSSNNANGCFNWFNPEDIAREHGEACSIREMIARMADDHGTDPRRVFVTGLSAGGAMTAVMLATYPEVFSAGAVIAGLPFGVAGNVREALSGMHAPSIRSLHELGDLVRAASHHRGPWPRLSVWHGSTDRVVDPANADEIVKQWLDLHRLPLAPMSEGIVDGYPRRIWWDADGETVVESYTITGMAHGTPLGVADNDEHYGVPAAFLIEAGISSSHHIAGFFGLTEWICEPRTQTRSESKPKTGPEAKPVTVLTPVAKTAAKPARKQASKTPMPDLVEVLEPLTKLRAQPKNKPGSGRRGIDVNAVITRALTAAGLMK